MTSLFRPVSLGPASAFSRSRLVTLVVALGLVCGPSVLAKDLVPDVQRAIELFKKTDPEIARFFDTAAGYVVFPNVGKGGFGIGAAHGNGLVYQGTQRIGHASMTQVTVGLQLGGQSYSEVIFFENQETLNDFKESKFALSAQASAIAAASGAATTAKYVNGVLVFTLAKQGLMVEASVGGQKFKFWDEGR